MPTELNAAVNLVRRGAIELVRRYNRHELQVDTSLPETPALIVSNHGFGGGHDLNVFALLRTLDELGVADRVTYLTHQIAWTLGVGPLVRELGCRPASKHSAEEAFAEGRHVAVFPGGDVEASKAWRDRNRILFGGRTGYARLAIDNGVPIVPVVTAGAGDSLFVLTDGQDLAKALDLPRRLRLKALPLTVSIPWGVSIGVPALLPYVPLPVQIRTAVLPAMYAEEGETPESFAARIEHAMQARMDGLAR
ncbi:1-acyl-sn-glycerol-3-phosphate acyltransferase [Smaragdicoccus niigatensis]|uniref:1-acyl-sn-glycerol-3-phosphate acyltransferase n=1 Tax=Smaragdicoccus niigatensis TaxID=359359 RepID=UPI00036B4550|nr:1-acyl-sn-glycerol-3-phosphate acyltransferase [Smaragdicoccus niigatensis]